MTHNVDLVLLPGRSNKLSLLPNLCSQSSNLLSTALHIFAPGAPMTLVFIDKKTQAFWKADTSIYGTNRFLRVQISSHVCIYIYLCYISLHTSNIYIYKYISTIHIALCFAWCDSLVSAANIVWPSFIAHAPSNVFSWMFIFWREKRWLDDMVRDNAIQPIIQEKGQTLNSDNQLLICSGIGDSSGTLLALKKPWHMDIDIDVILQGTSGSGESFERLTWVRQNGATNMRNVSWPSPVFETSQWLLSFQGLVNSSPGSNGSSWTH